MPKVKLTAATVGKTRPPGSGRLELWDTQVPGLALRITAKGIRSWCIRYRASGKQRRFTIGSYPAISLSKARTEALEAMRNVQQGQDIQREKEAARIAVVPKTLAETFSDFIEGYAKKKNRRWKEVENIFDRKVKPKLGKRPIADITRADLISLFDGIDGPHAANKLYRYMRRFFRWCMEKGRLDENPILAVGLPHPEAEKSRDRILSDSEIVIIWNAAELLGYPFGGVFKLLLILGQRREEVGSMRWRDLDLKEKIWTIPREVTKSDRTHIVPLPPLARELIEAIPHQDKTEFLFTTTRKTSVSGFSKAKAKINKLAKEACDKDGKEDMPPWRTHDLRRTVASGLARLKVPQIIIEKVQNRATGEGAGVAGVYNRYSYMDEREAAMAAWARHIEFLISTGEEGGDIIELQSRRS
jgi:integrase